MQPDRRRSAALRRPVPASAGGPSQSRGRFAAPRDVFVPVQGGVAYRDSRPPSDAEAPAPPPEGGGQGAPGGPAGPGQPPGAPPYGPGPSTAPPQGAPYGQAPQDAPPQGPSPGGSQRSPGDGGQQDGQQDGDRGSGGQGDGQGGDQGNGQNGGQDQPPPPWGSQWSSHQPPPGHGSWGGGDQGQTGSGGPGGPQGPGQGPGGSGDGSGPDRDNGRGTNGRGSGEGPGGNLRWDPTDPAQRRARYALLAGMWGFFFALFNWWPLALLLGALALYWGIDALRGKARTPGGAAGGGQRGNGGGTDAFGQPVQRPAKGGRPHTTAAIIGIVAAGITLAIVFIGFSVQIAYRDYFNCRSDALTEASKEHCSNELPKPLRTFFERD